MSDDRAIAAVREAGLDEGVRARMAGSPRRWALAGLGVSCVVVGVVGIAVPGLPTTVFLLGASWCFVRSCPYLESRLRESRLLGPYVRSVGPGLAMPRRARVVATAAMWVAIGVSLGLMWRGGAEGSVGMAGVLVGLGVLGTATVWLVGRGSLFGILSARRRAGGR